MKQEVFHIDAQAAVNSISLVNIYCKVRYWEQLVGYVTIWSGSLVVEVCMIIVSLRGTVADDKPREPMQILIYIKQGTLTYFQPTGISPLLLSPQVFCPLSWLGSVAAFHG